MSSKEAKDSKSQDDNPEGDEVAAEVLFDDWDESEVSAEEPSEASAEPEPEDESESSETEEPASQEEASLETTEAEEEPQEEEEEEEPAPEPQADSGGGFSIVDLIIQEQLEKNALVLAPKEEKKEPEPAPESDETPEDAESEVDGEDVSESQEEQAEQIEEEAPAEAEEEAKAQADAEADTEVESETESEEAAVVEEESSQTEETGSPEAEQTEPTDAATEVEEPQAVAEDELEAVTEHEPEPALEPESGPEPSEETEPEPEPEPEEEDEESDEWELTPEELAELAELEAELEAEEVEPQEESEAEAEQEPESDTEAEPEPEVLAEAEENEADIADEPSEEKEDEEDGQSFSEEQKARLVQVFQLDSLPGESSEDEEEEADEEAASAIEESKESEEEPTSLIEEVDTEPAAETLLLGASSETLDESGFETESGEMLLGPAAVEAADDIFKPAEPKTSIWDDLQKSEKSPPGGDLPKTAVPTTEPPEESDVSSSETGATASTSEPTVQPADDTGHTTLVLSELEAQELKEASAQVETPEEAPPTTPISETAKPKTERSVGGQLRNIEKVLTESVPDKLPWGIQKRAIPAMRFLSKLKGIQRGMVIAATEGGELECVASGGVEGEKSLDYAPMRLFKFVFRSKEPLILLDGKKDPRFINDKQLQELGVKSSLCVPFKDCVSGADGLLYVDNLTEANAFTYQDLRAVKEFAKKMSTDHQLGEPEEVQAPKPPQEFVAEQQPTDPRLFIAAAVAAIVLVFPALSNPTKDEPTPEITPISTVRVTSDPRTVVLSFIRAIETRNANSAYKFLSAEQQQKINQEAFEKKVRIFAGQGNNAWILSRLSLVEDGRSYGKKKRYVLVRPDKEDSDWKISVQEDSDGSWYVSKILGMNDLSL